MDANCAGAADAAWETLHAEGDREFTDLVAAFIWRIEEARASGISPGMARYVTDRAAPEPGDAQPGRSGAPRLVPTIGTVRRLQALMLVGWPVTILAGELGCRPHALRRLITGGQPLMPAATAAAAAALYDRLWDKPGPSARTRELAVQRGWAPALAWDDETIDSPAAVPQGIRPRRSPRASEVLEDADELAGLGLTVAQAAGRLGVSATSLDQARRRRRLARETRGRPGRPRSAVRAPAALAAGGPA